MDTGNSPTLLTVTQVAATLAVSRWTVYQLIWSGQIASVRIGRIHRIPQSAVETFVAALLDGSVVG